MRRRLVLRLSPEFWSHFTEAFWEQQGLVLPKLLPVPLATPAEAFRWIVKASDRYRAGGGRLPFQFYIDQAKILVDIRKYLPNSEDGSAAGYAERLTRELRGRRFGLVVDDIHTDGELWLRLRPFLQGLYRFTGIPGEANATAFLGNYTKTPFGVHKGRSTNFMFVVQGRKRIRAWPDAFFRNKQNPITLLTTNPSSWTPSR